MTRERKLMLIATLALFCMSWILAFYATIPDKVSERLGGKLLISESSSQIIIDEANYTVSGGMFDKSFSIVLVSDEEATVSILLGSSEEMYDLHVGIALVRSYKYEPILLKFDATRDTQITYDVELKGSKYKDPLISVVSLVILMSGVASGRIAFRPEPTQK